jgi:hypothetical protein
MLRPEEQRANSVTSFRALPGRRGPRIAPRWAHWAIIAFTLLLAACPRRAQAQVFIASVPNPGFTIGSLFVRAMVTRGLHPATIEVFWSLNPSGNTRSTDLERDLYLLWPTAVTGGLGAAQPDPALVRAVESTGGTILSAGRLPLFSRSVAAMGSATPPEPVPSGAPFVTFTRRSGPAGGSNAGTYIRIPGNPKLADPNRLMMVRMTVDKLVEQKTAAWFEELFRGRRYTVSVSFGDVRFLSLYPLYFAERERVVRLSEDLSQLMISFSDADHLRIVEVNPSSATERRSEIQKDIDTVALVLDKAEGLKPQILRVQFAYFHGLQAVGPILITFGFFVLGNLAGPLLLALARHARARVTTRLHVGRRPAPARQTTGTVLSREVLAKITVGETTYAEVLRLCGPQAEEHERLTSPGRRRLVYRGRRLAPRRRRTFGWFATESDWVVEHHEVDIEFDQDRVSDVQAQVRRSRAAAETVYTR